MDTPESRQLIPGLCEETAMLCLAKIPRAHHKTLRQVCRSWRTLLLHIWNNETGRQPDEPIRASPGEPQGASVNSPESQLPCGRVLGPTAGRGGPDVPGLEGSMRHCALETWRQVKECRQATDAEVGGLMGAVSDCQAGSGAESLPSRMAEDAAAPVEHHSVWRDLGCSLSLWPEGEKRQEAAGGTAMGGDAAATDEGTQQSQPGVGLISLSSKQVAVTTGQKTVQIPVQNQLAMSHDLTGTPPEHPFVPGGLYDFRRQMGLAESWVYLRTRTSTFVNHWRYFDIPNQVWAPRLPDVPYMAAELERRIKMETRQPLEKPIFDSNKVRGVGSAAVGVHLFVLGGWQEGGPSLVDVFCYDVISERWTRKASMPTPRCYMAVAVLGSLIVVAGGMSRPRLHQSELLVSADVYDTDRDTWTALPDMPFAMFFSCAVAIGDRVYVSGSRPPLDQGPAGRGCIYDSGSATWQIFHDKKLGDVMLSPCASSGDWIFAVGSLGIQAHHTPTGAWHTVQLKSRSEQLKRQSGKCTTRVGSSAEQSGAHGTATSAQSQSNMSLAWNRPPSGSVEAADVSNMGARTGPAQTHEEQLMTTALKDCVFVAQVPCDSRGYTGRCWCGSSSGCQLVLLHRSGAITLLQVSFESTQSAAGADGERDARGVRQPTQACTAAAAAAAATGLQLGASSARSSGIGRTWLPQVQSGASTLKLPRQDGMAPVSCIQQEAGVPVVYQVECLTSRPSLEDEQPVDLAVITL